MSLQTAINIVKGWPNPYVVEKSLPVDDDVEGILKQGEVVVPNSDQNWVRGVTSVNSTPFIIMVDSNEPSTARGAHEEGYAQVPWGNVHGIALSNSLEIETAFYKSDDEYAVGDPLSAPTGKIQKALSGQVVVGVVTKTPYTLGKQTYLTFIPESGNRVVA